MSDNFSKKTHKLEDSTNFETQRSEKIQQLVVLLEKFSDNEKNKKKSKIKNSVLEIPLSCLNNKELGTLEAIVKYLKEEKKFKYKEIGNLLNRDFGAIGVAYRQGIKKFTHKLNTSSFIRIPISIFSEKKHSILENLVSYLKNNLGMKFSEISRNLNRSHTTIWTTYSRYLEKGGEDRERRVAKKDLTNDKNYKNSEQNVQNAEDIKNLFLELIEVYDLSFDEIIGIIRSEKEKRLLEKTVEEQEEEEDKEDKVDKENRRKVEKSLTSKKELVEVPIPLSIFSNDRLSSLEAITKFLREEYGLSYRNIGKILGRDLGAIGVTYRNAYAKMKDQLIVIPQTYIPATLFSRTKYSVLENLVAFLKDHGMSLSLISTHLNRKPSTVRNVYMRYRRKSVAR